GEPADVRSVRVHDVEVLAAGAGRGEGDLLPIRGPGAQAAALARQLPLPRPVRVDQEEVLLPVAPGRVKQRPAVRRAGPPSGAGKDRGGQEECCRSIPRSPEGHRLFLLGRLTGKSFPVVWRTHWLTAHPPSAGGR